MLPGVFFIYDISPIKVKFTEKQQSFTYFLTSLCAIVGGKRSVRVRGVRVRVTPNPNDNPNPSPNPNPNPHPNPNPNADP